MKTSESVKTIMPALIKAQAKIGHAAKDATNPHFKNKYATLESVIDASKGPLLENKILISQSLNTDNVLVTTLFHESGEFLQSEIKLMLNKQDMQQLGSAVTYGRRYALAALLGISQEDDDGNAAAQDHKGQYSPSHGGPAVVLKVPGDFVIDFGTKFKGKKLSELSLTDIQKNIEYWKAQGTLSGNPKDFVANAEAYLKEQK